MSFAVLAAGQERIPFEASGDRVRTWQEAKRDAAARWVAHEVFQGKPVQEFIGPGLWRLNLVIRLDIAYGVVPRDELRRLRKLMDDGIVMQFTVGGDLVGDCVIKSLEDTWNHLHRTGVLTVATAALALEEYA
jgi:phage protein U